MRIQFRLIIILMLISVKSPAQNETDITGLWKGTLYNDTTQQFQRYEIAISEEKGKLTGFSHTWFIKDDQQYYGVKKVKIRREGSKIIIEDAGLIANNYPVAPAKNVRQLNILELAATDSLMTLSGPFSTNRTKEYRSLTGTISLQRKNDFWQSALVPHLQELGLASTLSFVERENVLARNVLNVQAAIPQATRESNSPDIVKANVPATKEIALAPVLTQPAKEVAVNTSTNIVPADATINTTPKETVILIPAKVPQDIVVTKDKTAPGNSALDNTQNKNDAPTKPESVVLVPKNNTPTVTANVVAKSIQPAAEVEKRTTNIQQVVYFKSDSLQLSLYDNGEVDGDTVSVLMNGQVIMAKERLSTNAVRKTIYMDHATDSIQLVMYAENLGTIAPNTGLLVVRDGKDLYEIRFSGDLQKNAAIIFRRKK
ncbi:MAG: hypothetical protein JWQ27_1630 [Ferruginibacter sp.]|nr:hypothetical protein [Ferruginibacter sp.]